MRRAVFLDRDGVLNRAVIHEGKPYPPERAEALEILPDAAEACIDLRAAGFLLIVVTNQPDVARGWQTRENVEAINSVIKQRLPLHDIRVCYHDDQDNCSCRKPRPGLLISAAEEFKIDLAGSFMVGDRCKDIAAGKNAGCRTVFIDHGYSENKPQDCDVRVSSLAEAVKWILGARK